MSKADEITLLKNPAFHTMAHNGYISLKAATIIIKNYEDKIPVIFKFNKEYFN